MSSGKVPSFSGVVIRTFSLLLKKRYFKKPRFDWSSTQTSEYTYTATKVNAHRVIKPKMKFVALLVRTFDFLVARALTAGSTAFGEDVNWDVPYSCETFMAGYTTLPTHLYKGMYISLVMCCCIHTCFWPFFRSLHLVCTCCKKFSAIVVVAYYSICL